ncbi:MAG: alpha/beta hydrolase [Lachnospiraceae bacterium]|nr:alpha/beta hydrolase [Lachnospiraceae bacterium]
MNHFISEHKLIDFFEHEGKDFLDTRRSTGKLAAAPEKNIYYELYRADAENPDKNADRIHAIGIPPGKSAAAYPESEWEQETAATAKSESEGATAATTESVPHTAPSGNDTAVSETKSAAAAATESVLHTALSGNISHASVPVGLLVLCHGYTETCTKYHELIYYFLRHGFHVLAYDHRGHGRSFREVENPYKIHAEDFDADYVGDLDLIVQKVARREFPALPLFLYGHSMGGCVAARYIELHPEVFSRCILSSPMFGIKTGSVPNMLTLLLARFMKLVGQGKRYILGQHDFLPDEVFEVSAATSPERFDRYNELRKITPEFQLSGGDYSWLYTCLHAAACAVSRRETAKIKALVLLFEAENDAYVPRARIAKFRKNLPDVQYHAWRGTKHEIYNSPDAVVKAYYKEIFRFLSDAVS